MKLHKKLLSLILSLSTLFCCFANLSVMASDIDVSSYTYVVDNMTFYKGDEQIYSLDGITEVAVDVTRQIPGGESDRLIIATYSDSGKFIGINSVSHYIDYGETGNFKVLLNVPRGKTVGEIKAFVWKSFSSMTPLSNVLSSNTDKIYSFVPTDLDDYDLTGTAPYLKFYVDGATTSAKYLLDTKVKVLVNGVEITTGTPIVDYVINGNADEIDLIDTYKTDGLIDTIYVSKYVSGMFDYITSTGKVEFTNADAGLSQIILDDEDEDLDYNIYYNNRKITVDDLQKNDVLTIAYDVTAPSVRDSKFYDIYVSRDIITDSLKGKNNTKKTAKFGDTYYQFSTGDRYTAFISSATLGNIYKVYLDALGRVFKAEFSHLNYKYAIAEKFTLATADDVYKLTMFTAEGESIAYYFDANTAIVTLPDGTVIDSYTEGSADALNRTVRDLIYAEYPTIKNEIESRVIQYKIKTSSGKIVELKFMPVKANTIDESTFVTKAEYSEDRNAIGTIKIGDDTRIIDATKYASEQELSAATPSSLTDGASYKAYAYGDKFGDAFIFILITEAQISYTASTRFAVVTEDGYNEYTDPETGEGIFEIKVMCADATSLEVSGDMPASTLLALRKGEVILFKTNAKGQIYEIDKLTKWSGGSLPTQAELAAGSLVPDNTTYSNLTALEINDLTGGNFGEEFTHDWTDESTGAVKLVYGPVMERTDYDITFGKIDANCKTDLDAIGTEVLTFQVSDNTRVYTYDYNQVHSKKLEYQGNKISSILPTFLLDEYKDSFNTVTWNKTADGALVNHETVTFAFAIVVNDEVQDILAFLPK